MGSNSASLKFSQFRISNIFITILVISRLELYTVYTSDKNKSFLYKRKAIRKRECLNAILLRFINFIICFFSHNHSIIKSMHVYISKIHIEYKSDLS